jgi:sialidase-1
MLQRFTVSRDDSIYEAWPDVALTPSGALVCVFSECTHHGDRGYTRIVTCRSTDRGRTWSEKRPVTEGTRDLPFYNCARITQLRDGRLAVLVDKLFAAERSSRPEECRNLLYFSEDEGATWSEPATTAAEGIVPDRLLELADGRWIVAAHYRDDAFGNLIQRLWYSDDQGASWSDPVVVGRQEGLNLCEVSVLPVAGPTLVAFHRENSGLGLDCYKTISHDRGESWSEPIRFPLPGCHRPVAGWLHDGRIFITYRFIQGGRADGFMPAQNFFAALTDKASALALTRRAAGARILPVDYDRSPACDLGYSGWVQFEDGEIYIVNYLVDDAPKGQIRGYSLDPGAFILEPEPAP